MREYRGGGKKVKKKFKKIMVIFQKEYFSIFEFDLKYFGLVGVEGWK